MHTNSIDSVQDPTTLKWAGSNGIKELRSVKFEESFMLVLQLECIV